MKCLKLTAANIAASLKNYESKVDANVSFVEHKYYLSYAASWCEGVLQVLQVPFARNTH
jgi:hypothetical protein